LDFPPSEPRKRGGQPGNTNARKHGFYSARLLPAEISDLDQIEAVDMSGEIDLIRTQLRRLLEDANAQPASFQQRIELIRVICIAVRSLNRLIRTHHNIYPETNNLMEMRRMTEEIRQDLVRAAWARDPINSPRFPDPTPSNRCDPPAAFPDKSVHPRPAPVDPDDPDADDPYLRDMLTNPAFVDPMDVQDY